MKIIKARHHEGVPMFDSNPAPQGRRRTLIIICQIDNIPSRGIRGDLSSTYSQQPLMDSAYSGQSEE
jgi:hypothetical protein